MFLLASILKTIYILICKQLGSLVTQSVPAPTPALPTPPMSAASLVHVPSLSNLIENSPAEPGPSVSTVHDLSLKHYARFYPLKVISIQIFVTFLIFLFVTHFDLNNISITNLSNLLFHSFV